VAGQEPVLGAVPKLGQHNESIRAEVAEWLSEPNS
jgi:hypothetical protein